MTDMVFEDKNLTFDQKVFDAIQPWVSNVHTKIMLVRRELPARPHIEPSAALTFIVEHIVAIAESQHPFSDRIEFSAGPKSDGEVRSQDAAV